MRFFFVCLFSSVLLFGCCHSKHSNDKECKTDSAEVKKPKAGLADNLSLITGVVTVSYKARGGDFLVKVKVTKVEEAGKSASIAVVGEEYLLAPSFVLNAKGEKEDNERNRNLSAAGELVAGDNVTASVFMTLEKGWFFTEMKKIGK